MASTTTATTAMPTAELLARLGAVTTEDAHALRAVEAGAFNPLDCDPARLSPCFRKVLAERYGADAVELANALLDGVRRRASWTHTIPQRVAVALARYAEWMRGVADQARATADVEVNDDYAIESAYADQFAGAAEMATSSALAQPAGTSAALIDDLTAAVDTAAARSIQGARILWRVALEATAQKLHGLHHAALLAARTAQQALVPAF